MKYTRLNRIEMIDLIITAIVFFIIGRLTAKYKFTVVVGDGAATTTPVVAPIVAPVVAPVTATTTTETLAPEPVHVTNLSNQDLYDKVYNVYIRHNSCGFSWRAMVPSDIATEFRRRNLSGTAHGMCYDDGKSGMHIADLSL